MTKSRRRNGHSVALVPSVYRDEQACRVWNGCGRASRALRIPIRGPPEVRQRPPRHRP